MVVADHHKSGWKASVVNGVDISGWDRGPHIWAYLNQRGSEGWELVSWTLIETRGTSFGQGAERMHAVLKRAKT
jgi:hypothetical protein